MKNSILFIGLITLVIGFLSFTYISDGEPWEIPAEYESMENPVEATADNIAFGKTLYTKHCKSCHGSTGVGDGPKSRMLDTEMPDISSDAYKAQKDGVKYYQSIIGRDEMPNYEKKIPEVEDRWAIINYMETL
jgi:mono/diheme cytochrome c family protein